MRKVLEFLTLISGFSFQISVFEIFLQSYETNSRTESSRLLSNANLPHLVLNNLLLYLSSTQLCSQVPPSFVLRPHPLCLRSHPALFSGPTHLCLRSRPALFSGPTQLCSQALPTLFSSPTQLSDMCVKHLNEASMHMCPNYFPCFHSKKFGTYNF